MKSFRILSILALLAALAACQDMDVVNVNNPDAERALGQPGDVEALLGTGFYRFFKGWTTNQALAVSMLSNEMTTTQFQVWGMITFLEQPRPSWTNSPTGGWRWVSVTPWENFYAGLASSREAMIAINQGMRFPDGTTDQTPRNHAYIKFNQGLIHGWLALFFDQAHIIDETVNLDDGMPDPSPYQEVMEAAIGYLEEAIQLAEANAFQLPGGVGSWINGRPLTNAELAQWAHAFLARYLAAVARTPAERAQVDWSRVAYHAERAGDADGTVEGDSSFWWWAGGWYDHTWIRGHYDLLGPGDESGGYQTWRATPLEERTAFTIVTSDRRIHGEGGPNSEGTYWRWHLSLPFPPEAGGYIRSHYENKRWEYHRLSAGFGPIPVFLKAEMDLLRAEARLQAGDIPGAVDLINISRVGSGKMEQLAASISMEEAWKWLKYEKLTEIAFAMGHVTYFERRGWGDLICGSQLHFPIPGVELELLNIPQYYFSPESDQIARPPDCMPLVGF